MASSFYNTISYEGKDLERANARRIKDFTGMRFNSLLVLKWVGLDKWGQSKYSCLCDCGKIKTITGRSLITKKAKSCGCIRSKNAFALILNNTTHGLTKHPLFRIRKGMIERCYKTYCDLYKNYGAKGVNVCEEWLTNFKSFYDWAISNGWKKGLQIDRYPNRSGNYEPANCRIATAKENSNNKDCNKFATIDGVTHSASEWSELTGQKRDTICKRINRNLIGIEAVYGKKYLNISKK